MASDQQVHARAILAALAEFERQGSQRAMQTLEQLEPDLAEFTFERLTAIYHGILALGGPARKSRRLYRQVQTLVLVSIAALRQAQFESWRQSVTGTRLAQLDPSLNEDGRPPPPARPADPPTPDTL